MKQEKEWGIPENVSLKIRNTQMRYLGFYRKTLRSVMWYSIMLCLFFLYLEHVIQPKRPLRFLLGNKYVDLVVALQAFQLY